jgi:hypothetical protein
VAQVLRLASLVLRSLTPVAVAAVVVPEVVEATALEVLAAAAREVG